MNDCYWGGDWDQYYYECDTGRIIGEIKVLASQSYEAYYVNAWGGPRLGKYIDSDRARKAVGNAHKKEEERWERMRKAWNSLPKVSDEDLLADLGQVPLRTPKKTWWKIWE